MIRRPWSPIWIGSRMAAAMAIFILAVLLSHLSHFDEQLLASPVLAQTNEPQISELADPAPDQPDAPYQIYMPLIIHPYQQFLPLIHYGNAAPEPHDPFPAHDAIRQSLNAYLHWEHDGDPEGDDYYFEVYLEANDETPDELISETTEQFVEPSFTFELDTQYYWQVVAMDARGAINIGPIWTFHSEDAPNPPPVGEMITIPSGRFNMGCDWGNPAEDDGCAVGSIHVEVPLRSVYLDAYEIDKYEVTNGEYRRCVEAGVCTPPRRFSSKSREHYYDDPDFDYFPVLFVSHWDAEDYCGWVDKRLPTEAEWEKAARGAVDTRKWPWGNEQINCERAEREPNYNNCMDPIDSQRVGSHPLGASPYGVMDVAGNAFEWVADLFDAIYYSYAPNENPPGPEFSRVHANAPPQNEYSFPIFSIRGGSYVDRTWYMRTAYRHWGHHGDIALTDIPYFRSYRVGFRCAKSIEEAVGNE